MNKINRNIEWDKENFDALRQVGWKVIVVWECQLKKDRRESTFTELVSVIKQNKN